MAANHVYLIRGSGVANSPFFETEEDCKLFLQYVDRFLRSYMTINLFQNNCDGWAMIVSTKSTEDIKQAYKERRARSKKCKKTCSYNEVWKILSDQVRILLSTYVKATNQKTGRKGGKVRSSYERFVFESPEEAQTMQMLMKKQRYRQQQPCKRYRPARKLHRIRKKLMKSSPFLSCASSGVAEKMVKIGIRCLNLTVLVGDVLRHLVQVTLYYHFPT